MSAPPFKPSAQYHESDAMDQPEKVKDLLEVPTEEVQVKLADPTQHLLSASTFESMNLPPPLLKGLYAMGYQKPSKIQEKALPLLLTTPFRNFIGQSQSGTGKTAAFTLALLCRVNPSVQKAQGIILAPTRELANQILSVVKAMSQFTQISSILATKDSITPGQTVNDHIVVGTPGTLQDLLRKRIIQADAIQVFIIDEADEMLDKQGMGDQTIRVQRFLPPSTQVVLFSATYRDDVRRFAERVVPNANMIQLKREELSVDAIRQLYLECQNSNHRYQVLCDIYGLCNIGQSIIFCGRRDTADQIAAKMAQDGHQITVLHGKLDAADRDRIFNMYRTGQTKVLITTNVMARGIDILDVTLVINYDLPTDGRGRPDFETYLHRIGRTGRFGRRGISINFVYDEQSARVNEEIAKYFGKPIARVGTQDLAQLESDLKAALKGN
ncbi:hypothetical protein MP228_001223 [Amoeboaphelidium protococcarum]|nr:hypothetical protein MP228_012591 [Amoeboaphelidium protococcarum]KAI3653276.1 hypothetical protein MP228_001223 [Amoeboaphelidium protococcarum]